MSDTPIPTPPPPPPARDPLCQKVEQEYMAEAVRDLGRRFPRGLRVEVSETLLGDGSLFVKAFLPRGRGRIDILSRGDVLERKTVRQWVYALRNSLGLVR